jgi:DNA-3-methyladenine glycosylase II
MKRSQERDKVPPNSLVDRRTFRAGFEHIKRNDPILRPILERRGELKFEPRGELFESLVESILSQQLASAAAESIIGKVKALFPDGSLEPKRIKRMDSKKLRAAGVSPQKMSYLKDLSSRVVGGRLDLEALRSQRDEKIVEVLDEVKGVGPWTVHMLLIFTLGRADVLPVDDFGIRKSIQLLNELDESPKKEAIEKLAEKWHTYCTVASLYLWGAKDQA